MNKIKLLYDVVKTMKGKDIFEGTLKAEAVKDDAKILSFDNTFQKNTVTGQLKAKIITDVNCDGNKMKMENDIDINTKDCHKPHEFMKRMHSHHSHAPHCCGGIKGGLGKLSFVLGIFSSIKLEENQDKSAVLSLESADIPEDLKAAIHEHIKNHKHEHAQSEEFQNCHKHHQMFMKEFCCAENINFRLRIFISKDSEVKEIILAVTGEKTDENNVKHNIKFDATLNLN